MPRTLAFALLALVLIGGCVAPAGTPGTDRPATTPPSAAGGEPTASPVPTESPTPADLDLADGAVPCEGSVGLALWGLGSPPMWSPDGVRVGYSLPANTSALFVVFVDGEPRGDAFVRNTYDDTLAADGDSIALAEAFDGRHAVRVVRYADTNGNGGFDPGVDAPCADGDGVEQAGPAVVDFDRFE
ncbi:hypothetical protein ACFQRB_19010 [Halobaculum litoreum]|uniref:Uncharacterized protein n=1 Tax=Halobaculum litoreum TaxID=3031998 RepID=A0ABD5XS46_9EURY